MDTILEQTLIADESERVRHNGPACLCLVIMTHSVLSYDDSVLSYRYDDVMLNLNYTFIDPVLTRSKNDRVFSPSARNLVNM